MMTTGLHEGVACQLRIANKTSIRDGTADATYDAIVLFIHLPNLKIHSRNTPGDWET